MTDLIHTHEVSNDEFEHGHAHIGYASTRFEDRQGPHMHAPAPEAMPDAEEVFDAAKEIMREGETPLEAANRIADEASSTPFPTVIEGLWAVLSVNADGTEGIVAVPTGGQQTVLVAVDEARGLAMGPMVQQISDLYGLTARLVHFTRVEDVATYEPHS